MSVEVSPKTIATLDNGKELVAWTLKSATGLKAVILNYGGILHELWVPDAKGKAVDVVLGMKDPRSYVEKNGPYFNALIGRFANRIAQARFELDGSSYLLTANKGAHQLHGGPGGLHQKCWDVSAVDNGILLRTELADGEDGYPGTMKLEVRMELTEANGLLYHYRAETDKATVINLTSHPYFNLRGESAGKIGTHRFRIDADRFLPTDGEGIPSGELALVSGTPFDFRELTAVGPRLEVEDPQLTQVGGIDHCLVFHEDFSADRSVARVEDPASGRIMDVFTTEPAIQFYTGNFLEPEDRTKSSYQQHTGFCLETQHLPDSPNHPEWPSTRLDPGQVFQSKTEYRFSC